MFSVLVTPPTVEPITLVEAKAQCRVTHVAEDELIGSYVSAARQYAEEYTRRALITQTWRTTFDSFPYTPHSRVYLPRTPVLAVTEVAYTDGNGASQLIAGASYSLFADSVAPYLLPVYATEWPTARDFAGAVRVTYTAGYGPLPTDVPHMVRQAIRLMVEHFYRNRSAVEVGTIVSAMKLGADALLDPFRVRRAA